MKSKKILSFVLAALLCVNIMAINSISAAAAAATLTVSSAQGAPGSKVNISVSIGANSGVAGMDFVLKFDKTKLDVISATPGSILSGSLALPNPNDANGIIFVFASDNSLKKSGSVLDIVFKIKSSVSGTIPLNLFVSNLIDSDYKDITPKIINGSITVVPATPTSVKAASASYNSIKISWGAVSGASGYEIYRSTAKTGSFSLLKSQTSTSYTNTSLTTGKYYYYKVRAYKGSSPKVYGAYSVIVSAKPVPAAPSSPAASSASYSSIKISWKAVSGASGYEIYRSTSKISGYTLLKTLTATSYINSSLTTNKTYYYKITAYKTVGSSKVYSAYSAIVSTKPVPSVPGSFTAAKASSTSVKTSWRAVSGANGYEVWRATSSSGSYSLMKTTTATSYTNTGLTKNKTYYYKVRAYRTVSNVKVYSAYTVVKSVKPC